MNPAEMSSTLPSMICLQRMSKEVIFNPVDHDVSRSSGLPIVFGFTPDGRYILVVYEKIDDVMVYPVTAYDVEE